MKKVRIFYLALAAILSFSLLAGCQGKNTADNSNSNVQTGSQPGSSMDASTSANADGVAYPLKDAQGITFTYWEQLSPEGAKVMTSYAESDAYQALQEKTGVKLKFIHPAQGQVNEQFNIMIASGEYPDMIQDARLYKSGGAKAVQDGVYLKLNDLIEKYAPDYHALRNSTDDIRRQTIGDNGDIWCIYPILNRENPSWYGPVINKEILAKTGLAIPVTIEDWTKVLQAFKANGVETPVVFDPQNRTDSFAASGIDTNGIFLSAFNVGPGFYRSGDKVQYGPIQPEFKDYLSVMRQWYAEGLVDSDFPVRDINGVNALFTNKKAGAYLVSVDSAFSMARGAGFDLTAAQYPVQKVGDKVQYRAKDWYATTGEVAVTTACKHPEIAVEFLNYGYTKEGEMLFNFGEEGKSYVMQDGKPAFTELVTKNPDVPIGSAIYKFKIQAGPHKRWGAYANAVTLANPEGMKIKEMWTENGFDLMLPPLSLTADEGQKAALIMNDVRTYQNEAVLKFIMGAESIDNFDSYVNQIKKMGIDEATGYQQAAFDRYLKR